MPDYDPEPMFDERGKGSWSRVLFVDPGLGGTGLAFWRSLKRPASKPLAPDETLAIVPKPIGDWQDRANYIRVRFAEAVDRMQVKWTVIEFQALWSGSATSMASGGSGDLFKLTYLTGLLAGVLSQRDLPHPVLPTPQTWKGQLSKKAVDRRITRAIGRAYPNHVSDAVGMGLAAQGRL